MLAFQNFPEQIADLPDAKAWLLTLARNICMDLHRERKRSREVSLEEVASGSTYPPFASPVAGSVPSPDPERLFLERERDLLLRASIQELPMRLRRTAELHFLCEMRYAEIARKLDISEVNVRKRIQEARGILRRFASGYLAGSAAVGRPRPTFSRRGASTAPSDASTNPRGERIVALRPVQIRLSRGIERDVVLRLISRPRRQDSRRLSGLMAYTRRHGRGWKKRLELARALREEGRFEEAVPHYLHVVDRQPSSLTPWLELGASLDALGRRSEAAAVYATGSTQAGREADRLHLQGLASVCQGDWRLGVEALQRASAVDPRGARHFRALGEVFLAEGCPVEAAESLERSLALDELDPLALSLCHDSLLAIGQPLAARARARTGIERGPADVLALERFVSHLIRAGQDRSEEGHRTGELIARLKRLYPERAETQGIAAVHELARGHGDKAESLLSAYLGQHPENGRAWLYLGRIRFWRGRSEAAIQAALTVLRLEPDDRESYLEISRILSYTGAKGEVHRLLASIQERFASHALLLAEASGLALRAGDASRAEELCREAVRLQPRLPGLRFRHASTLVELGRYEEAVTELTRGWELLPPGDGYAESAPAALLMAECHAHLGIPGTGRDWLSIAIDHGCALLAIDPAAAMACRGRALERLGDMTGALDAYLDAMHRPLLYPLRGEVESALKEIRRRMGRTRRG